MSISSDRRSDEFLNISDQFKLGGLVTEASHPATARLSEAAKTDIATALEQLFEVDADVVAKYREFAGSGRATTIASAVQHALEHGGRIFFTGCGSTGRLSIQLVSIWREFWQRETSPPPPSATLPVCPEATAWEHRAFAVMAGGDYALIKAVEGFEDFSAFGRKQLAEHGVTADDVVFAITEGGETSFVIGTAWQGVEAGARVYFVYNNPDEVLCGLVERSREIIADPRVEKVNLTTGPMAITGSTRMQATTIQLCVMLTVLEMVVGKLTGTETGGSVPNRFLAGLTETHATLQSAHFRAQLAKLVALEEGVYRTGHKNNYFADGFGIDALTDTTERSPTFCTPPFRKFDDTTATESWAFLFIPIENTPLAWERIIRRKPGCLNWHADEVRGLVPDERLPRTVEILGKIGTAELLRFRIGLDGLKQRPSRPGGCVVGIVGGREKDLLLTPAGFVRRQLEEARAAGAGRGLVFVGNAEAVHEVKAFLATWDPECIAVLLPVPVTGLELDGVARAGLKMLLNALSTCTMVRLGRVMGNTMIWVVPSNLKLIDRSSRYIARLANLDYTSANRLLFEVIEHVEPRMKADQAYPPVVGMAVLRARDGLSNAEAEKQFMPGQSGEVR